MRWRRDSNPAPAFHSRCSFVKPGSKPYSPVLKPEEWKQLGTYTIENEPAVNKPREDLNDITNQQT